MTKYHVIGIGNAVVDVISQCDDAFSAAKASTKA